MGEFIEYRVAITVQALTPFPPKPTQKPPKPGPQPETHRLVPGPSRVSSGLSV